MDSKPHGHMVRENITAGAVGALLEEEEGGPNIASVPSLPQAQVQSHGNKMDEKRLMLTQQQKSEIASSLKRR